MKDVKQTLNGFIDYSSPKLCAFLSRTWKNQQQAITYKEIREAIFAGQLDPGYLAQWQQDYSKFIINGYAPLAQQAIDNSAHEMQALFGLGAKSLNYPYMDSFIATQGGKLIREVSEEQYKAINVLVRQASFSETMDMKELAKAIRPTVGLTARQAQAAYNRYQQAIADGYSKDEARAIQAKYAEKLHRTRAETISITEMAYAYNYGQQAYMEQCVKDGLIGGAQKKWMTALDERVCAVCGKLDGEVTEMDTPFSAGVLVPPAHPRCRCAVNYINVTQPANWVDTPAAQPGTTQAPDTVEIPQNVDISGLKYQGQAHMGGTGEMHLMTDSSGSEWIFKPAQSKSGIQEPFRAYVQEAGYKVQGIVDPDSAVPVGVGEVSIPGKGKILGAAQQRIGSIDAAANVLSSGELLATTNRYGRGIFASGASSFADMGTGGADSVFTRIVFDNQVGNERRYGSFGDYVFVFDAKTLERTDWYAYDGDRFGTTEDYAFNIRYGTAEHFQRSRSHYRRSNELLFRKALSLDTLTEVRVPSSDRQALIDKLHSMGISQINGIRLENLIKVGGRML